MTDWTRRETPEWIGRTPDSAVPDHVRQRIYDRAGGICHISGRHIRFGEPWDLEHVVAIRDWTGEGHGNRESNLRPALRDKHRRKTADENTERAAVNRKRSRALGIKTKKPGGFRGWRKMDGTPVYAKDRR